MKKHLFTLSVIVAVSYSAIAQNGNASTNANAQWRITGNSASTSDFIGTTNNQSLILKTNNIQRAIFDTQGRSIFDGGGEVIIHPGGLNRPILSNPIAAYMLKVGGSGHFEGEVNTRQLFVQEYITYLKSLKGPRIDVDTIRMDSTRGIYGHTKIVGDLQVKQNLTVEGDAVFRNNLTAEKGILFDNINGISYSVTNGVKSFSYGRTIGAAKPLTQPCAAGPQSWANHQFGGMLQIYDVDAAGNYISNSGLLNFQTWSGGSSIDASVGGQTGQGGLLLNYFCGNNTFINTGSNGGKVSMGKLVEIGMPYPSSNNTALNIKGEVDFSGLNLITNHTTDYNYNTALTVNRNGTKALGIFNFDGTTSTEKFIIWGSGRTDIKASTKTDKYFVINDVSVSGTNVESFAVSGNGYTQINVANPAAMDNVFDIMDLSNSANNGKYLFRVKSNGHVFAREVEIRNTSLAFPDYVFSKDYKRLTLEEIEIYINENKHLPGFEKAEYYETKGIKSSEMFVKQQEKIEELTLYIIELEKRLKALENSNKH